MIDEIKTYPTHYGALLIILTLGGISILLFRFDPALKPIAIYSTGLLYVLWGILHHHLADYLRLKVVLEYFLVAVLGILIINALL